MSANDLLYDLVYPRRERVRNFLKANWFDIFWVLYWFVWAPFYMVFVRG